MDFGNYSYTTVKDCAESYRDPVFWIFVRSYKFYCCKMDMVGNMAIWEEF